MDFKVIWADEAITDLREICSYIARHDPEAALRMEYWSKPFYSAPAGNKFGK